MTGSNMAGSKVAWVKNGRGKNGLGQKWPGQKWPGQKRPGQKWLGSKMAIYRTYTYLYSRIKQQTCRLFEENILEVPKRFLRNCK